MASHNGQGPVHSTGRGGQGNIGHDPTVYTDGSIVREGVEGPHRGEAEYSTGIGGAGNIDKTHAMQAQAGSAQHVSAGAGATPLVDEDDYVPEPAMREKVADYDNYHTGRGGQGNVHKEKYGGHSTQKEQQHADKSVMGVVGKVKDLFHSHGHDKKGEEST